VHARACLNCGEEPSAFFRKCDALSILGQLKSCWLQLAKHWQPIHLTTKHQRLQGACSEGLQTDVYAMPRVFRSVDNWTHRRPRVEQWASLSYVRKQSSVWPSKIFLSQLKNKLKRMGEQKIIVLVKLQCSSLFMCDNNTNSEQMTGCSKPPLRCIQNMRGNSTEPVRSAVMFPNRTKSLATSPRRSSKQSRASIRQCLKDTLTSSNYNKPKHYAMLVTTSHPGICQRFLC